MLIEKMHFFACCSQNLRVLRERAVETGCAAFLGADNEKVGCWLHDLQDGAVGQKTVVAVGLDPQDHFSG